MTDQLDLGLLRGRGMRLVRQTEVAECGLACLAMIINFHGMDVDLASLRRRLQPSLRGASLTSLMSMADRLGMTSRAVKVALESLGDLSLPAVLHWDMTHFVVIERVRRGVALIHDPAGRSKWMPSAEVSKHFTGVALELHPADDFQPHSERSRIRLPQLWQRITGLKRALVQVVLLSVLLQAFVLASPYYLQIAIDSALPAFDKELLMVLALGFGIFALINAGASLLRSFVLLSAGTAIGYGVSINVARRLFRLPVDWFERRHVGDVLSRFQSIVPIRQFMTEGAVGSLLDGSLAIFTLAVMFFYSPLLTVVALTAFALYGLVRAVSFAAQRRSQDEAITTAGREQSTMIESLRGILTLRLFNRESARHSMWQSQLTDAVNAGVTLSRLAAWQQAANTLVFGLETIISVWLAMRFVIAGGFSVGMVFAFIGYKTQFLQRSASLVDQVVAFRMLDLHLERLSDVALAAQDPSFTQERDACAELTGKVELRGVSFRYGSTEPWVLDGLDLTVEAGEHVAITGPSGGGKSTLVKVLLGLVEPDAGAVLIDGVPLARFGYKNFHDQLGAVLQNDNLFAGSLADNIALFDASPDHERVVEAARAAVLHDEIQAMPMRYETLVGDMGSSLSGGQRQRLILARALYRRPRLLLMDEGTSHLDSDRERTVNSLIAGLGITRIVVAHRIETIIAADRIYRVQEGRLIEVTAQFDDIKRQFAAMNEKSGDD